MKPVHSISIAGSGNVARHLGIALMKAGIRITYCWNRTPEKALKLAGELNAEAASSIETLQNSDLILCCLSDDALTEFIPILSKLAPVAATSGTANVVAFPHHEPVGVFYPLQTFSPGRDIDLERVPFFIESTEVTLEQKLLALAGLLSKQVHTLSWEKRQHLHLAAVLVNNFTNHLADIAQRHLEGQQIPFEWLLPLLDETIAKLRDQSAFDAQTGPARRNDLNTIQRHIELLQGKDAEVYKVLTSSISQRYHND